MSSHQAALMEDSKQELLQAIAQLDAAERKDRRHWRTKNAAVAADQIEHIQQNHMKCRGGCLFNYLGPMAGNCLGLNLSVFLDWSVGKSRFEQSEAGLKGPPPEAVLKHQLKQSQLQQKDPNKSQLLCRMAWNHWNQLATW